MKEKWKDILTTRYDDVVGIKLVDFCPYYKRFVNNILSLMDRKLSKIELQVVKDEIDEDLDNMAEMSRYAIQFIISNWTDYFDEMIEDCLDGELYEIAHNIKEIRQHLAL